MIKLQHFTKADWLARDHGLVVLSACSASLPAGIPWHDHYGNRVTATTAYIGTADQAGTLPKGLAYGRLVHSIHQQSVPIADVLIDIAEQFELVSAYPTRDSFESFAIDCLGFGRCPADRIDEARQQWRDAANTVDRAKRCLPAAVVLQLGELFV